MKKEIIDADKVTMQSIILCPFLVAVINPERESEPKVNVATISYVGIIAETPPMIGLAIRPRRLTHKLIKAHGEFTLNLPSLAMLADLDFCGSKSGKEFHKAKIREIKFEPASQIHTPLIAAAPLNLECRLVQAPLTFPRKKASHDYFIAEILAAHRLIGFAIENHPAIVTANRTYREVGNELGIAYRFWQKGGQDAISKRTDAVSQR